MNRTPVSSLFSFNYLMCKFAYQFDYQPVALCEHYSYRVKLIVPKMYKSEKKIQSEKYSACTQMSIMV